MRHVAILLLLFCSCKVYESVYDTYDSSVTMQQYRCTAQCTMNLLEEAGTYKDAAMWDGKETRRRDAFLAAKDFCREKSSALCWAAGYENKQKRCVFNLLDMTYMHVPPEMSETDFYTKAVASCRSFE